MVNQILSLARLTRLSGQVLFKRKPVQFVSRPLMRNDQEIWAIEETDEIFTDYEDFLQRLDFYKQKRFICEITGHSGLNFFDALRSEMDASEEVDDAFPDALKEPILRKVQFSTISRIDNLVDHVFEEFKTDFYPGENVTVIIDTGERLNGVIREKTKFPEYKNPDGTIEREAFARYFVSLTNRPDKEALVDDQHIIRDRRAFTKQMLRSYLKNTVNRESWAGAPWLVKARIADDYRINTDIPPHLRHENKLAERKANIGSKRGEHDGFILNFFSPHNRYPELKPKGHKSKLTPQDLARSKQDQFLDYQRALNANPSFAPNKQLHQNETQGSTKPPPPPPIKYPIEDLEIPPVRDGSHRPALKYLSQASPALDLALDNSPTEISMDSVGPLLETWDTLNVYCEVFLLDSFTFDDFIEALQFRSTEVQCELLIEIHCAVLKKLVNDYKDMNGQVQIQLPAPQDSGLETRNQESSPTPSPTPEPEAKPLTRATRSSLAKSEAAELKATVISSPSSDTDAKKHRAAEMDQSDRSVGDWKEHLRKRQLKDGRWILVIVGLLNQLSGNPRLRKTCDEVLLVLAPLHMEATVATAISQYSSSHINVRVKILQILCMLSLETKTIRAYIEDCASQMTDIRKEKIEFQRTRKSTMEELRLLHEERKALQPDVSSPSPAPQLEDEDMKIDEIDEEEEIVDSEDERPHQGRSLRRANDRANERKKKQEEEKERKEKAKADKAKKPSKEAKQLDKLLKKIEEKKDLIKECEEEIAILDNDLRETDCPRTRVLGKDRFWNRYYWMERNAMPYAGLPDSSTAAAGYANGRLWVQGPDDLERNGFIELSDAENAQYRRAFQMSVPERKIIEEGPTHTFTAHQWGYYDDPEQVDALIAWLDVRGHREIKLRKELQAQKAKIGTYMQKREEYLSKTDDKKSEPGELTTRVSTRTKTYVDPAGHRCLAWRNTTALKNLGHLHSESHDKNAAERSKRASAGKSGKKAVVVEDEGRQTRASNKQPKTLGRQGTRYNF